VVFAGEVGETQGRAGQQPAQRDDPVGEHRAGDLPRDAAQLRLDVVGVPENGGGVAGEPFNVHQRAGQHRADSRSLPPKML